MSWPTGHLKTLSWSISGRLNLLYTLSVMGLMLIASLFLYHNLDAIIDENIVQNIAERMEELREAIRIHPHNLHAIEEEIRMESIGIPNNSYYFRLLDQSQQVVVQTQGMKEYFVNAPFPDPPNNIPEQTWFLSTSHWQAPDGEWYLLASSKEKNDLGWNLFSIQSAYHISSEIKMLSSFKNKLILTILTVLIVASAIGLFITKTGLRPLQEIAITTQKITANHLHERLSPQRWPKELTVLATSFDDMLQRLENSFVQLTRFSADIAHELRTPINNLRGETEVILAKPRSTHEYLEVLQSTLEEYDRLSRMVDNLLFLSRAESPKTSIQKIAVNTQTELLNIIDFHHSLADENNISLSCHGQAILWVDPLLLQRAVSNLIVNALQFTPPGGKIFLAILPANEQGFCSITVTDNGLGIPSEHLPHIFERFYRVDPNRSHIDGTVHCGLGLSIVQSIMHLHDGFVRIQSTPHVGTSVSLFFPMQ